MVMKPPMGKHAESVRPFQKLYIDILGPYHLSKFHWLCPLRKLSASAIEDYLEKHIFHVYGVPESIVSDNGSQFRSNELNAFFTKYGVNHVYTALYSPQSNASERVNRSLIAGIRAYVKNDHKQWDDKLSFISCALRNSVPQTIHSSPYHALFGFDMVTHSSTYDLLRKLKVLDEPTFKLSNDDNLQNIRQDIRRYIKEAYDKNQNTYNLRTRPIVFNVGQIVYRRNFALSNAEKCFNAKLSPTFVKARVKERLGSNYYVLEDLDGKPMGTYHGKDIRA